MTIKKQYLKSKPEVKVTFEIEPKDAQEAEAITLLSEHNGWKAVEFKKLKSGKFKAAINVQTDKFDRFQYTFQVTGANKQQAMLLPMGADDYVDNGMTDGGKNAVLQLA